MIHFDANLISTLSTDWHSKIIAITKIITFSGRSKGMHNGCTPIVDLFI